MHEQIRRLWLVDDPAEVTPAWLTSVLRAGGTNIELTGLRYEPIGSGQLGASYRFHLQAASGGGPATVVLKMGAGSPDVRALVSVGYRSEVGFYRRFASAALIRIPRCWSAEISENGRDFTLVLEDAHPALPGSQVDGCTVVQAAAAVRNLAGLHAPFWNHDGLTDGPDWLRRADEASLAMFGEACAAVIDGFLERHRTELSAEDADTLRRAIEALSRWGRFTGARHSLIHGDYRLDNLLFAGDREVTAVDWQSLEVGFPARDLAYFLSTALPPEVRRGDERSLVEAYHGRLVENGVTGYSLDTCFDDYRLGMLQGPLITVLGCMYAPTAPTESSDRMFVSMATRACSAIRDAGTLDLVSG